MTPAEEIEKLERELHDGAYIEAGLGRLVRKTEDGPMRERMRQRWQLETTRLDAIEVRIRILRQPRQVDLPLPRHTIRKAYAPVVPPRPINFIGIDIAA